MLQIYLLTPIFMETQQAYTFDSDQIANRFLNDVRSGTVAGVTAKLFRDSKTVRLSFSLIHEEGGFDSRAAELDDMARHYEGVEVSL